MHKVWTREKRITTKLSNYLYSFQFSKMWYITIGTFTLKIILEFTIKNCTIPLSKDARKLNSRSPLCRQKSIAFVSRVRAIQWFVKYAHTHTHTRDWRGNKNVASHRDFIYLCNSAVTPGFWILMAIEAFVAVFLCPNLFPLLFCNENRWAVRKRVFD